MMENRRLILYILLIGLVFALWQAWQKDYPKVSVPVVTAQSASIPTATVHAIPTRSPQTQTVPTLGSGLESTVPMIEVKTDVLKASINTQGGSLVRLALSQFPNTIDTPDTPIQLLSDDPNILFVAESGLIGSQGPDTQTTQAQFKAQNTRYELAPGQNQLEVPLTFENREGLRITKIFTFQRGQYTVAVRYQIDNHSVQPWSGQLYTQLRQQPPVTHSNLFSLHTFSGAALSTPAEPYEKFTFAKLSEQNIDRVAFGGWLAMQQHYFLSSWIPNQTQTNHYYSRQDAQGVVSFGVVGPEIQVPPGSSTTVSAIFYGGPELPSVLKLLAPHLDLTINYGWLWPISEAIFWVMKHLHAWLGNWGWSIVIVTVLIKVLFYQLSATSYRSMAKLRRLTPKLQAIKDRYGEDRQKMSRATMELYRKEKVNPLGGCLPMLIQIPFFIGLYYVLIESVELRQAPFIFWIRDLSVHDPYYILPVLMGITMWLQQRLNPPSPDPMQARMMTFLPVIFTVFFLTFPAGLVLYWLVNNCLSVLQQWWIIRKMA